MDRGSEKTKPNKANYTLPNRPKEWEKEKNRKDHLLISKDEAEIFDFEWHSEWTG